MAKKNTTPTEDLEQANFVGWLDSQGIPYWHTHNEMWTKSWKQKKKARMLGVKSGIPDLFLCYSNGLVGIEMKRAKGGVVSDNQKEWGAILEACGVPVFCCRGAEKAKETVAYIESELGYKRLESIPEPTKLREIGKKTRKSTKKPKNDCPF